MFIQGLKGAYITTVSNQTHNYNQSSYAVFHFDATLLQRKHSVNHVANFVN